MSRNATFTTPTCWGEMPAMGFLCQGSRPYADWAQGLIRPKKWAKKKPPALTGGFYVIVT